VQHAHVRGNVVQQAGAIRDTKQEEEEEKEEGARWAVYLVVRGVAALGGLFAGPYRSTGATTRAYDTACTAPACAAHT
jgi:hypothetical protein